MYFLKNLLIVKRWIGLQQIAVICIVLALVVSPFMIRSWFNKKKSQDKQDYRYVEVPTDYEKPKHNAQDGGPSYFLIWAIVLIFIGLIGLIAVFATGINLTWIVLPILVVLAGIVCLLINSKFK